MVKETMRHGRDSQPSAHDLKLIFHQAARSEYVVKNPVVGVAMYREPLDSMRVITFGEQTTYLSKASQPLRDIARVMLYTGMRPEEVFRMQVRTSISNRIRFSIRSEKRRQPAESSVDG